MPSSAWSHLAARSPWGQLTDEDVGLLVLHCLRIYLLYALVWGVTSHEMGSLSYKLNLRLVSLFLKPLVSPRMRARGLLSWSRQSGEELNSLSSGLDKELI